MDTSYKESISVIESYVEALENRIAELESNLFTTNTNVMFDDKIHMLKAMIPVRKEVYDIVTEAYNDWITEDKKDRGTLENWCKKSAELLNVKEGQILDIVKQKYDRRRYI